MSSLGDLKGYGVELLSTLEKFEGYERMIDTIDPTVITSIIKMKEVKTILIQTNVDILVFANVVAQSISLIKYLEVTLNNRGLDDAGILMGELVVFEKLSQLEKLIYAIALIKTIQQ